MDSKARSKKRRGYSNSHGEVSFSFTVELTLGDIYEKNIKKDEALSHLKKALAI